MRSTYGKFTYEYRTYVIEKITYLSYVRYGHTLLHCTGCLLRS